MLARTVCFAENIDVVREYVVEEPPNSTFRHARQLIISQTSLCNCLVFFMGLCIIGPYFFENTVGQVYDVRQMFVLRN